MSYKAINTIVQDKNGYMWLGSQEGLHRYDGYDVITYHHDVNDQNSLSADVISTLMVDSVGRLWVGTREGLNLYNPANNSFTRFIKSTGYSLLSDNVNYLMETKDGRVWVGTDKGINVLTLQKDNQWTLDIVPLSASGSTILSIYQTEQNEIWVGTNGEGVYVLDQNGKELRAEQFSELSDDLKFAKIINTIFQDRLNNIWIGTADSGLIKISASNGSKQHFTEENLDKKLSSKTVESLVQDASGNIWIATDKGLSIYHSESNRLTTVKHSSVNNNSLSGNYVLYVFEDSSQMVWIGTMSGVSRWDPHMATFLQYDKDNQFSLASKLVTAFSAYKDKFILVSTYEGEVYQLNIDTQELSLILDNNTLGNVRISALNVVNDDIWIGTRAAGLIKYSITKKQIAQYQFNPKDSESISANSITNIYFDSKNRLWVSTFHNGFNLLTKDGRFKRFLRNKQNVTLGPSSDHILQIKEDSFGDIWLATYGGGVNRFDVDSGVFVHLKKEQNNNKSLSSDLAWFLNFDAQGNLWIGTQASGINVLSRNNIINNVYEFSHLNVKDGMKDQTVYGLVQDDENNIWFSSNKGISRFSTDSKTFKHFDSRHGLTDLEFNHGAVFKANNGSLFFGSARGFNSIEPRQLLMNQVAPVVKLNNIYKLNEPIKLDTPLNQLKTVTFNYYDQLVAFEYVGLNFSEPEATRYQYRLLGFDDQWIDAGKSRRATYTNLPAGQYAFQVKAVNSDDVWSEPPYTLDVTVLPAPWHTWWAYLLYVLLLASLLLLYSRFTNRKLVLEQEQRALLKEQVIEKTEKYVQKNNELEKANIQLEKAAIVDKITGVKSRRYLDIYIEQTSKLMSQIHKNLLPVQRELLPRLYIVMIQVKGLSGDNNGQLINLVELMQYSRNVDDLVVRWSDDIFAIIGYEKENSAADLSARLASRFKDKISDKTAINIVFNYYPFDLEQPLSMSWDQISVLNELALNIISNDDSVNWLGLVGPKLERFEYIELLNATSISELAEHLYLKHT